MKTAVISYSLTGNNNALATRFARELKAEHIKVTEQEKRTNGTIAADILFQRTPPTQPGPQATSAYRLTDEDIEKLSKHAIGRLKEKLPKEVFLS